MATPCGMWKFPGQGLNPLHSRDPICCSDNARYLTSCATRELFFFFVCFAFSRATPTAFGSSQARGQIRYSCQPTPQPQQCKIWAMSAIHTTAHSNARSLTHWERPGIEPAFLWILVGFINCWATKGTPTTSFLFYSRKNTPELNMIIISSFFWVLEKTIGTTLVLFVIRGKEAIILLKILPILFSHFFHSIFFSSNPLKIKRLVK